MPIYFDKPGQAFDQTPPLTFDARNAWQKGPSSMQTVANIYRLSAPQLVLYAQNVVDKLTGNPNIPTPFPTTAALQGLVDALTDKNNTWVAAQDSARLATSERQAAMQALIAALRQEVGTVDAVSQGDPTIILSTGFTVRATPTPVGPMPQVTDVKAAPGVSAGTVELAWKSVKRTENYTVQFRLDTEADWTPMDSTVSKPKVVVSDLESGKQYWFRIAANGTEGTGPFSDAVCRIPQ